jgi:hypothetical protein
MLTIPLNTKDETYAIFGVGPHVGEKPGATLKHGQSVKLVSANPKIVHFGPDHTPKYDKDGVQAVASGNVVLVAEGGPVEVTATVVNASGAPGHSITDTITVTAPVLSPAVPEASGELWNEALPLAQKAVPLPEVTTTTAAQTKVTAKQVEKSAAPVKPVPVSKG